MTSSLQDVVFLSIIFSVCGGILLFMLRWVLVWDKSNVKQR